MRALFGSWKGGRSMILVVFCLTLVMFTVSCGKVKEGVGFIRGMEEYVYGYPLVMMDVTRAVMTATPTLRGVQCSHQPVRPAPHSRVSGFQERGSHQRELALDARLP